MSTQSDHQFLGIGYRAAIILSFICIFSGAAYLFIFQLNSPSPKAVTNEMLLLSITAERRLLLLSTALFIAMAFGFLGFALFLIQAKGDVDAEGSIQDYKFKFARLSPGLFVILCATIIIIFAATFRIDYGLTRNNTSATTGAAQPAKSNTETLPEASDEELGIPSETDTSVTD